MVNFFVSFCSGLKNSQFHQFPNFVIVNGFDPNWRDQRWQLILPSSFSILCQSERIRSIPNPATRHLNKSIRFGYDKSYDNLTPSLSDLTADCSKFIWPLSHFSLDLHVRPVWTMLCIFVCLYSALFCTQLAPYKYQLCFDVQTWESRIRILLPPVNFPNWEPHVDRCPFLENYVHFRFTNKEGKKLKGNPKLADPVSNPNRIRIRWSLQIIQLRLDWRQRL